MSREIIEKGSEIVVGQRIYSGLYGGREGVVYRIEGEQKPETIKCLNEGVGIICRNANIYVVFHNGTKSCVPEGIIRGVQWKIFNSIADVTEIDALLAYADLVGIRRMNEEEQRKIAQEDEKKRIKEAYSYLIKQKESKFTQWSLGAKNIRIELKHVFPKIKFSVKTESYSGGCSINIKWTDGPNERQVKEITSKYQYGHFDGMNDIYEYTDEVWTDIFGGAKYVFENRIYSDELIKKAIQLAGYEHEITVEDWKQGRVYDYSKRHWINDELEEITA